MISSYFILILCFIFETTVTSVKEHFEKKNPTNYFIILDYFKQQLIINHVVLILRSKAVWTAKDEFSFWIWIIYTAKNLSQSKNEELLSPYLSPKNDPEVFSWRFNNRIKPRQRKLQQWKSSTSCCKHSFILTCSSDQCVCFLAPPSPAWPRPRLFLQTTIQPPCTRPPQQYAFTQAELRPSNFADSFSVAAVAEHSGEPCKGPCCWDK